MFLNYKNQNVHYVPLLTHSGEKGKEKPITKELDGLQLTRAHVILLPGINEVSADEFKVIKHHASDLIEAGLLEVMEVKSSTAPGKPQKVAASFSEVPIKKAVEMAEQCLVVETLQAWKTDPRPAVAYAATKQLKMILKKEGKKEEDLAPIPVGDDMQPVSEGSAE